MVDIFGMIYKKNRGWFDHQNGSELYDLSRIEWYIGWTDVAVSFENILKKYRWGNV